MREAIIELWLQAETLAIIVDVLRFENEASDVRNKLPEIEEQALKVSAALHRLMAVARDA